MLIHDQSALDLSHNVIPLALLVVICLQAQEERSLKSFIVARPNKPPILSAPNHPYLLGATHGCALIKRNTANYYIIPYLKLALYKLAHVQPNHSPCNPLQKSFMNKYIYICSLSLYKHDISALSLPI